MSKPDWEERLKTLQGIADYCRVRADGFEQESQKHHGCGELGMRVVVGFIRSIGMHIEDRQADLHGLGEPYREGSKKNPVDVIFEQARIVHEVCVERDDARAKLDAARDTIKELREAIIKEVPPPDPDVRLCWGAREVLAGLGFVDRAEQSIWQRSIGQHLVEIQATMGDKTGEADTWWMTVAGRTEDPGLEFSGSFSAVIMQFAAVAHAIAGGVFTGTRKDSGA